MKNLVSRITASARTGYPGSQMDNNYITGSGEDKFQIARTSTSAYGSVDLAIWTDSRAQFPI